MGTNNSIFITGGTGFVGKAVISELLKRGHTIKALVRNKPFEDPRVTSIRGGLFDDGVLNSGMAGCDAVIHLVGIIRENRAKGQTFERIHFEGAKHVIDAAKQNGIPRFIHMSALGARVESPSEYASTKAKAEQYLRQSDFNFTILRPSMILGRGGEFAKMIDDWAHGKKAPWLFMPYFGTGFFGQSSRLIQPIAVEDVACAFANALEQPEAINQTIELAGPEQMTWPQMYERASGKFLGKPKRSIGIPAWYAKMLTYIVPPPLLPFNFAQVAMAIEDNVCDINAMESKLRMKPRDAFALL